MSSVSDRQLDDRVEEGQGIDERDVNQGREQEPARSGHGLMTGKSQREARIEDAREEGAEREHGTCHASHSREQHERQELKDLTEEMTKLVVHY